ncbi:DUF6887 family protein [Kovacikia minuta]|nr:hypothetical protein [Kovacikia minuta]
MTSANYAEMRLDELRQYVLTHGEDVEAFYMCMLIAQRQQDG